jgi:hypothetical protein
MKILDIPMLQENHDVCKIKQKENGGRVALLFVGSINPTVRNPRTIIEVLTLLSDTNIQCEFVGNISCPELFEPLKKIYGERLVFTNFIAHDEVVLKIAKADILLNIGNLVSTMVPSKIFEYMSYGKPIISTFEIDQEPSCKYLSMYPLSLLLDGRDDIEKNTELLKNFIRKNCNKTLEFKEIKQRYYLNTPQAFADLIID